MKLLLLLLLVVYSFASSSITSVSDKIHLKYKVNLSSSERQWLQNHKTIKIGVDPSYAPYAFFSSTGEYKGVSADITYLIGKILNIKMEVVPNLTWPQILEAAKNKEIDLITTASYRPERTEYLAFSKGYIPTPLVIMTQHDDDKIKHKQDIKGKKIALVAKYSSSKMVLEEFNNLFEPHFVKTPLEGLAAVASGEADGYIGVIGINIYQAIKNGISNLKVASSYNLETNYQNYGVRKDWAIFAKILDKTLDAISEEKKLEIFQKWIPLNTENKKNEKIELSDIEKKWLDNHKTIRISNEKDWAPFNFIKDGEPMGFSIDYFRLLSQKIGIKPTFVQGQVWNEFLTKTKNKEHDVMLNIRTTPKRKEYLEFTDAYTNYIAGFLVKDSFKGNITPSNISELKIAVVESFSYHEVLKKTYPNLEFVLKDSTLETIKAVLFGEADAAPGSIEVFKYLQKVNLIKGLKTIAGSGIIGVNDKDLRLYMATRNDWPVLVNILNKGMEHISQNEINTIRKKWFSSDLQSSEDINLTYNEAQWLVENRIKMCVDPSWMPFEKITQKGEYSGMGSDFMALFSKKLGYAFELVRTKTWNESLEKIKNKECDILPMAVKTSQREIFLDFSNEYVTWPQVIVTNQKEIFIDNLKYLIQERIGVKKSSAVIEILKRKYPKINLVIVKNKLDGLKMVSDGKLFGYIDTSASVAYSISKENFTNLKIAGNVGIDYKLSVAVKKETPELLSIVNKLINTIKDDEKQRIFNKWISVKYEHGFDYALLWKIIAVFVFFIIGTLYWNRKLSTEIESRKEVEEALSQSQERLELALEGGALGLWDVNFQTGEIIVNDSWAIMHGYEANEIQTISQEKWIETIYKDDIKMVLDYGADYKIGKIDTYAIEYRVRTKNNEIIWVLSRGKIVARHNDSSIRMVGTVSDITAQKSFEEKLKIQKDKAEIATKAKSDFLSNMSHEIRTPMNAILGFAELLDENIEDKRLKSFVKTIRSSGQALLFLINDILDLSKIESGKLELIKSKTNVANLFEETINIFKLQVEQKGLKLNLDIDKSMPNAILIDKIRLNEILINLIGNAIKFTHNGYINVLVTVDEVYEHTSKIDLIIKVEDSGIGIDTSQKDKIFNIFEQVENQDTKKYGGTGLGLSISRKLANLMGGSLEVMSELGKGTTFVLNLKNIDIASVSHEKPEEKSTMDSTAIKFDDAVILVVDDIDENRELVKESFSNSKIRILEANNGQKAIEVVENNHIDLILMDIRMPVMNGYTATRLIKEHNEIPIIALTASIMLDDLKKLEGSQFDGYLRKPVSRNELFNELLKFLSFQEPIVNKDKKEEIIIDDFEKLKEFLLIENLEIKPLYLESLQTNDLNNINRFSTKLFEVSSKYEIEYIINYSEKLLENIESFEIGSISTMLDNYKNIIKDLESRCNDSVK